MRCALLLLGVLSTLSGCTHLALQNHTVRTTDTLADLQFQQVLDNVARFHDNPDTVPSFAVATAGTTTSKTMNKSRPPKPGRDGLFSQR